MSIFYFETNSGQAGDKNFIKIIFDIKIEFDTLEILDALNFNKFWEFLILDQFGPNRC